MALHSISASAVRRFSYCPRWYYINYMLGFHAKSPIKAKFPIGDSIHKTLSMRNKDKFRERISDLVRSEEIVDEGVPFDELVGRGELLADKALEWISRFDGIVLQEKLVQHKIVLPDKEIELVGYPDLVATRQGENVLVDYKIGYDAITENEAFAYAFALALYKLGLIASDIKIGKAMIASMVMRTRKERYSTRAKTPIVDIVELPVCLDDNVQKMLLQVVDSMVICIERQIFPALGVTNGVCIWCPNGRELKNQKLCFYPDSVLKEFSQTSLQRTSIERWRDEI